MFVEEVEAGPRPHMRKRLNIVMKGEDGSDAVLDYFKGGDLKVTDIEVEIGETWKHVGTGLLYEVLDLLKNEADDSTIVKYCRVQGGEAFYRSLHGEGGFLNRITVARVGHTTRFVRVED